MSVETAEYTLLIVESPTLARRLEDLVPDSVLVIPTGGFLWKPVFDKKTRTLKKKAIADKLDIRREIRDEAKYAVHIIVATDSDPSGDFIAWSLHKDLKSNRIRRGQLTALTHSAIRKMLISARDIDFQKLHIRLENRFRIRQIWNEQYPDFSMVQAGLNSIFFEPTTIREFKTDTKQLLICRDGINTIIKNGGGEIHLNRTDSNDWMVSEPLSTFDAVSEIATLPGIDTYSKAQSLLQTLFEAVHPESSEGLITYPRTAQRAYFSDHWLDIEHQWIRNRSLNEFMPASLRLIAEADQPHDSIRPVKLDILPSWVESHLPGDIGRAYRVIYRRALRSLSIPKPAGSTFIHEQSGNVLVSDESIRDDSLKITPVVSMAELGHHLCSLGVLRPSRFGQFVDEALKSNWVTQDESGFVYPGKKLRKSTYGNTEFGAILRDLYTVADNLDLSDETIRYILSS